MSKLYLRESTTKAYLIQPNFLKITPILTLFLPENESNGLVAKPESQLTCLEAFDLYASENRSLVGIAPGSHDISATDVHVWLALYLTTAFFVLFMTL